MITEKFIKELNKYLITDKKAMMTLINANANCNDKLADLPNIQVRSSDTGCVVRMIGVINGLLQSIGEEMIAIQIDDKTNEILGFTKYINLRRT